MNGMRDSRFCHTVSLLQNGTVLVVGGFTRGVYLQSVELYNPLTGVWTVTENMSNGRSYHAASLLQNGAVLITGGYNGSVFLNSVELYYP